jgi:beta-barrel assembly-enhancing protease
MKLRPFQLPRYAVLVSVLLALLLAGCATNPVTGKRELTLVSEREEIALGQQHYLPTQQAHGGQYVIDRNLTQYVNTIGQRLAAVSDRPDLPYEFVVLNNSVPNAWAMPGGKIAINRGLLLELQSEAELAAVLAHEIVHSAARHGAQSMERGLLLQGGLIAIGVAARDQELGGLLVGGAQVGAMLVATRYGRQAELEADRYGMHYMAKAGYDPAAAISLQETFLRLAEGRQPNWLEGLFASHPPSQERVEANRATAADLPQGLRNGREEYQKRLATLYRTREAYAHLDTGRATLAKDPAKALTLAEQAIRLEPREALFHGLKGDALFARSQHREARVAYDEAIRRNPDFFQFHLQRGLVRQQLGDHAGARADLERSTELLPTSVAHAALGRQALVRGDEAGARHHLALAAGGQGEVARAAAADLARLELEREPGRYIGIAAALGPQGQVLVAVRNAAPVPVSGVRVQVVLSDGAGRAVQQQVVDLPGVLAAGAEVRFTSSLPPLSERAELRRVHTRVLQARIAD